ncbi:hypothetical protein, partial [Thiolapillus sp.]|uniref:hypothetical protein n=1 Tax=Thiolapillus sp. TaxID=2017437 RepID=UPI0025DBAF04
MSKKKDINSLGKKRAVLRRTLWEQVWWSATWQTRTALLAAGVLGDGLGALTDGVLSQFTGEQ